MCGLFGIYPKAGADPMSLRILALFLAVGNVSRGRHSFGAWGKGIEPYRVIGPVTDTDNAAGFRNLVFNQWQPEAGNWLAGHTRQATHGGHTIENTHPFQVRNLILAHNGVVTVDGYEKAHAVDSGRIAHALADEGYEAGFAKVQGSCALLFSVDDEFMVYRHNQVLHFVDEEWGWAISSQKNTLEEACAVAGLPIAGKATEFEADTILAPWAGVRQPAACKPYSYSSSTNTRGGGSCSYGGGGYRGRYDEFDDDMFGVYGEGSLFSSQRDRTDAAAKHKHLGKGLSVEAKMAFVRSAFSMLAHSNLNPEKPIWLSKTSDMRAIILRWSVLLKRFDNTYVFRINKVGVSTQHIPCVNIERTEYEKMTEEQKTFAWSTFYAKALQSIGVSTEDYKAAYDAYVEELEKSKGGGAGDDEPVIVCDWCGEAKPMSQCTSRNFGNDKIEVCEGCTSDFKSARSGMDFRKNRKGKNNLPYHRAPATRGNA